MSSTLRFLGALVIASAFATAGCGPEYDHTEVTGVVGSAYGAEANTDQIDVMRGLLVKAHIVVWNDKKDPMPLTVRSKRPDILEVDSVISQYDYAFVGVSPGTTEIELVADGTVVLTIPARVTEQPAP